MTLEQRMGALEQEVAELKRRLEAACPQTNWIEQITGSLANYPEFDDVVRLGAEFRQSQPPPDEA
jgi:hypothetical protein